MTDVNPVVAAATTSNPSATPDLIDVELEPFISWRKMPFGILLGGTAGLAVAGLAVLFVQLNSGAVLGRILPIVVGVAVALIMIPRLPWIPRRRERRMQQRMVSRLEDNPDEPIAESVTVVVNETLRYDFFGPRVSRSGRFFGRSQMMIGPGLKGLTRGLVACHRRDLTIRACAPEFAVPIQPIEVPIEPLPLDETVPFVNQLGDADQNDFDIDPDRVTTDADDADRDRTPNESAFRRRLKRTITLLGGRWVFVLFLFVWTTHAIDSLVTWHITFNFVVWTGILLMPFFFGSGRGGAWRARQQWLIVPGGLIARKPNRRGKWDVHLFDRRTSVLCTYRRSRNHWFVCVADVDTNQTAFITPTESLALLRAWLSPLPPPPEAQLGELSG